MLMTGSTHIDAERAFTQAMRARRRASLLRREGAGDLKVYDESTVARRVQLVRGSREIPLDAIDGTIEPARATLFDRCFRPTRAARSRWQRVWTAEHRGTPLPPLDVVPVGDGYAVRDGHHRVSVALARGAVTIDAVISP
jgi:hypothetical protein